MYIKTSCTQTLPFVPGDLVSFFDFRVNTHLKFHVLKPAAPSHCKGNESIPSLIQHGTIADCLTCQLLSGVQVARLNREHCSWEERVKILIITLSYKQGEETSSHLVRECVVIIFININNWRERVKLNIKLVAM